MRIVIIDDELLIVKTLASYLAQAGHDIVGEAGDIPRGLELIDQTEIDLAIVDANLNGVSAEPVVRRLSDQNIPILIISGYSQKQRPDWAQTARFLSKPFAPDDLLKAVDAIRG